MIAVSSWGQWRVIFRPGHQIAVTTTWVELETATVATVQTFNSTIAHCATSDGLAGGFAHALRCTYGAEFPIWI